MPVQVHLALGYTPATMAVSWATYETTSTPSTESVVMWGLSADSLDQKSTGDVRSFTADKGRVFYTHAANMTGLKPSTRYFYKVGDATNGFSEVFNFKSQADATTLAANLPQLHVIFGDMGAADAFTLCSTCTGKSTVCDKSTCKSAQQDKGLISEVGLHPASQGADMMLHVGDFAYDLDSDGGKVGDQFMVNIEQIAAYTPYM